MVRAVSYVSQCLEARSYYANSGPRQTLQSVGEAQTIHHLRVSAAPQFLVPGSVSDQARWVEQLPQIFQSQGFEAVMTDRHLCGDQYRAMWGQSNLAGYQDLVDENTEGVGSAEDIRKFVGLLEAEMKKGASFDTTFLCVVGRKPI